MTGNQPKPRGRRNEGAKTAKPRRKPKEAAILNPRYAGATPEMVARALIRPRTEDREDEEPSPVIANPKFQSST